MCSALAELIEDDNERYKVCACLPSFLACFIFQMYDISAVIITILVYYIAFTMQEDGLVVDLDIVIPFSTLVLSVLTFLTGPIGLFLWNSSLLWIYAIRIIIIILYSASWAVYIFTKKTKVSHYIVGGIWTAAVILYIWGLFVAFKAITYVTMHYRGYDDVDPVTQRHFDDKVRTMIQEMKEREQEAAKTSTPTITYTNSRRSVAKRTPPQKT